MFVKQENSLNHQQSMKIFIFIFLRNTLMCGMYLKYLQSNSLILYCKNSPFFSDFDMWHITSLSFVAVLPCCIILFCTTLFYFECALTYCLIDRLHFLVILPCFASCLQGAVTHKRVSSSSVHLCKAEWQWSWIELFPSVSNCCFTSSHNLSFFNLRCPSLPPGLLPISCLNVRSRKSQLCSSTCGAPWFQLWTEDWNGNAKGRKSRLCFSNECTTSWLAHQLSKKKKRVGGWWGLRRKM